MSPPATTCVADTMRLLDPPRCTTALLRRYGTRRQCSGRAVTVNFEPGPADGAFTPLYELLDTDLRGLVLVLGGACAQADAVWGEILTVAAARAGAVGVVVDGAVRDLDVLAEAGFGVWARCSAIAGATGQIHVAEIGGPVMIAGSAVQPGDLVVADGDGVAFIAGEVAPAVLAGTDRYEAAEGAVLADVRTGQTLAASYDHKRRVVADLKGPSTEVMR